MKISKTQLKQIIKEELAVILTNEEAGELFGEAVEAELEEKKKSFPDLTGDGKVTQADILKGRGVELKEDLGMLAGMFQDVAANDLGIVFLAFAKAAANIGSAVLVGLGMSKAIDYIRMGMEAKEAARVADIIEDGKQEGKSEEEILAMLDDLMKKA